MIEKCILLLLASNAVDTVDPRATEETSAIDRAIQSATQRDSFARFQHPGMQVSDLTQLVLRYRPHILHISGHGREIEGLVLDDDSQFATIGCSQLVKLILSGDANLRLVFFSFCHSEACASAISEEVPYAIGVRGEILADSAILFSSTFYEALASGSSVQSAFDSARETLQTKGLEGSEAMVLRVRSGTSAEVPFLSSQGFAKKSVEQALDSHLKDISSRYSQRHVWNQPGLTLEKSYVDLECGSLTWGDITESIQKGETALNPLDESSAPRTDLLEETLKWLQTENLQEFLVIEGSPGSGKSSFTIRLAVELSKQGYQPILVRLRDLGMGSDPIAEIGKIVLKVDTAALEEAFEQNKIRAVLILDGWDELTLVPHQNLIQRVGTFLESIRSTVLVRWQGHVPVILTGRPTKVVTTTHNMTKNTRILTIYRFTPVQLRDYLVKLDSIYGTAPNINPDIDIILQRYEDDWRLSQGGPSSHMAGTVDVIGWPMLAHVAYRLMRECEPSRQISLIANGTTLLRCLTEYYCIHSRNPSDDPSGIEVRSRLEARELRSLVQQTAVVMTVKGTECISHEELEREMMSWPSSLGAARNVKLAKTIDPDIFLINYLFKSGVEPLGCEFIHKSLREFAFAQAVVDNLKRLVLRSDKEYTTIVEVMTAAELGILSRRWLSREIWDHVESQIRWEIYRESPENEDPIAFQTGEPPLGIDAWCRIRDRLAEAWTNWAFLNNEMMFVNNEMKPLKFDKTGQLLKGAGTIDTAGEDARLGAAFFRLCATLHGILAVRIMETSGLMDHQKNLWEELGVPESAGPGQTTLSQKPDQRLRFFSPGKGDEELEQSTMKLAMAKINAYYVQTKEELPEKCNLTFLVSTGTALERLCFQYCNLSYSNLSESNLSGADLRGADLTSAWLWKTNLTRADLSITELPYASFRHSNLEGASLKSANIESADFREAKGLSLEQIRLTRNWQTAKFDPEFLARLQELEDTDDQALLEESEQ